MVEDLATAKFPNTKQHHDVLNIQIHRQQGDVLHINYFMNFVHEGDDIIDKDHTRSSHTDGFCITKVNIRESHMDIDNCDQCNNCKRTVTLKTYVWKMLQKMSQMVSLVYVNIQSHIRFKINVNGVVSTELTWLSNHCNDQLNRLAVNLNNYKDDNDHDMHYKEDTTSIITDEIVNCDVDFTQNNNVKPHISTKSKFQINNDNTSRQYKKRRLILKRKTTHDMY